MDVLNRLEEDLTRTLKVVQNGLHKVESDQQVAQQTLTEAASNPTR